MDGDSFEKVKKLMRIIGGKAVIVEDGEPVFVVISVDEYSDSQGTGEAAVGSETELIEKINKDITIWKNRQKEKEMKQLERDFAGAKAAKEPIEIVEDDPLI